MVHVLLCELDLVCLQAHLLDVIPGEAIALCVEEASSRVKEDIPSCFVLDEGPPCWSVLDETILHCESQVAVSCRWES